MLVSLQGAAAGCCFGEMCMAVYASEQGCCRVPLRSRVLLRDV